MGRKQFTGLLASDARTEVASLQEKVGPEHFFYGGRSRSELVVHFHRVAPDTDPMRTEFDFDDLPLPLRVLGMIPWVIAGALAGRKLYFTQSTPTPSDSRSSRLLLTGFLIAAIAYCMRQIWKLIRHRMPIRPPERPPRGIHTPEAYIFTALAFGGLAFLGIDLESRLMMIMFACACLGESYRAWIAGRGEAQLAASQTSGAEADHPRS